MAIFWNIFLKTFAIFTSILVIIILSSLLISYVDEQKKNDFVFYYGDKDSANTIAIIELNGLIIDQNINLYSITNPFIISPKKTKQILNNFEKILPKVIIFSINSPGGTVSASNNLYNIIKSFKKRNNVEIIFHTNELLASGGYWAATAADKIYANYGAIIGSIGVKGPEWFFYDHPKTISTGIFGNTIETEKGIKIYSKKAGKSKDLFNPFRKPNIEELNHLQNMVDEIYNDFIRIVAKERKIESNALIDEIGALIYTSKKARKLFLIDDEINLENLIDKIVKKNNFKNFKVIKNNYQKNSLLREIFAVNIDKNKKNINAECLILKSSIASILSYQSVGC